MKNIRSLWDETVKKYGPLTALKWLNRKETEEITYEKLGENVKKSAGALRYQALPGHISLLSEAAASTGSRAIWHWSQAATWQFPWTFSFL